MVVFSELNKPEGFVYKWLYEVCCFGQSAASAHLIIPHKENSMDLNRITLIGRMGSELTPKTIGEGEAAKQIVSFRFAVNSPFDDQATWLTIECWSSLADVVKKLNLKKSSRLYVEGKLIPDKETGGPRAWIGGEGEKAGMAQASYIVWADAVIALDPKRDEQTAS
jgi:hypothetical protein